MDVSLAALTNLEELQGFLARDSASKDKIKRLVAFLDDGGPTPDKNDKLAAATGVYVQQGAFKDTHRRGNDICSS
ncbi:uncharacterized protein KRP23_11289 [Phytophthora ramorum]|uniref:uncharacterized protein n=1 Tax=Phytophthora ramorum TaxID=164328 RepID=UPI00309FCB06|nr:hypothetical protein KRP23_11289 [Phytophthora ramorum]